MSWLRRLFGGEVGSEPAPAAPPPSDAEIEAAEREHEQELARAWAERLDDLRRRQLRYDEYAWTPPPQGGEQRAGLEDAGPG
jgi:hypothetical protein